MAEVLPNFDNVVTGIGDNPAEAIDNCLEQIVQCGFDTEGMEARIKRQEGWETLPEMPSVSDEYGCDETGEAHYFISIRWNEEKRRIVCIIDGKEYPEDELPTGKSTADATWTGCRAYRDMEDFDPEFGDGVGFLYSFSDPDKPDSDWGRYLWIYSEEHGNVDCVSHVVQKFLKKFRPDECWSLTYATTCSKPRVGEFGGGALFVTASDIKWQNAYDFVEQEKSREKAGTRIVLNVSGGVVQDVFCSDPQADVVLIDWDTDGCDPDTPGLVKVAGSGSAYVTAWDAESLDTMEATDVGAALEAWKREPGAPQ